MPGARGKAEIKLVLPEALKAQLDADAAEQGLDRSALITRRLEAVYDDHQTSDLVLRLDQVIRDQEAIQVAIREMRTDLTQVVTLIEAFMAAVNKPSAPVEKMYPTPATWEETYPELYAPKPHAPESVEVEPKASAKGWRPWRQ